MITLTTPKKIVLQEEKSTTISTLTITRIVDLPKQKTVRVFLEELDEPVILWEGAEYDAIGQWSDTDVSNKLNSIYNI